MRFRRPGNFSDYLQLSQRLLSTEAGLDSGELGLALSCSLRNDDVQQWDRPSDCGVSGELGLLVRCSNTSWPMGDRNTCLRRKGHIHQRCGLWERAMFDDFMNEMCWVEHV